MMWRKEPEPSKYGNRMIPAVKQLVIFLVGWIGFQILAGTIQFIMSFIAIKQGYDAEEFLKQLSSSMIVNSAAYLGLLIAIVAIVNFDIIKVLKSFKNWQSYVAGVVCLAAIFAFNYLWSFILTFIPVNTGDNVNEASLQSLSDVYPIACLLVFGIIGPICEEFTYRVGLFSFFRRINRVLGYVITIIIFAFIHFNFSLNPAVLINELLNLPLYMFAAFAFSYTYEKFGLAGSLTAHIANNLISLSLICIAH